MYTDSAIGYKGKPVTSKPPVSMVRIKLYFCVTSQHVKSRDLGIKEQESSSLSFVVDDDDFSRAVTNNSPPCLWWCHRKYVRDKQSIFARSNIRDYAEGGSCSTLALIFFLRSDFVKKNTQLRKGCSLLE